MVPMTRKLSIHGFSSMYFLSNVPRFFLLLVVTLVTTAKGHGQPLKSGKEMFQEKGGFFTGLRNASAINSPYTDFAPSFYENGLVYATSRDRAGERDPKTNEPFFELYYASLNGEGEPGQPIPFSLKINSHVNEGPVVFSNDYKTIYFTRNNLDRGARKANRKKKVTLKIYQSVRKGKDFGSIIELPFNNDDYSCQHPALSADRKRLYFASDMPGGFGGMDLYVCQLTPEGDWSPPINLGAGVNTEHHEAFPFCHVSGNLFFASTGHAGYGGFDLFMSPLNGEGLAESVIHLEEPFNSSEDDLGLILNARGTRGYLTSNRPGGMGGDDIYWFDTPPGLLKRTDVAALQQVMVLNEGNGHALADAIVVYTTPSGLMQRLLTDAQGQVQWIPLEYGGRLEVMKPGYVSVDTFLNKGNAMLSISLRQVAAVLGGQVLISDKPGGKKIRLQWLSPAGMALEIPVDSVGRFLQPWPGAGTLRATSPGYAEMELKLESPGVEPLRFSLEPLAAKVKAGAVLVLNDIYYAYNRSELLPGAVQELDTLVQIMLRYPNMAVELRAHTDSRGSVAFNQRLSEERAAKAMMYLIQQGIDKRRIKSLGLGKSEPRNRCADGVPCTEVEHQFNRRTEVRILRME